MSLDNLPVELLYSIFDILDTETIILSMKYVCKRLYLITLNYNRCKFNFQAKCKKKFHQLCYLTDPNNVISLTLSNDNQTPGQIELFFSLYDIDKYTQLRSVSLINIQELHLNRILKHLSMTCSLASLVIHCESKPTLDVATFSLISSTIGRKTLRKLDLDLGSGNLDKLEWPSLCSIEYLRLAQRIFFKRLYTVLSRSPFLRTMILRDCIMYDIDEFNSVVSNNTLYTKLISLKLEDTDLSMTMIESLLSLTPSLVQLTLIGNNSGLFEGARWEKFIQTKLLDLNKFQFALQNSFDISHDNDGLDSLIRPFQTPFWLETKQWYVTALCVRNSSSVNLYTTHDCASKINFHPYANKIMRSTAVSKSDHRQINHIVREMSLDLIELQDDITGKPENSFHYFFNALIKLTLHVHGNWPNRSLDLLSAFIDLSTITEVVLDINFSEDDSYNTIPHILTLLKQTTNINSLKIMTHMLSFETICSIITHRIKHLQIPVKHIDEMKTVLQRFRDLHSVTFKFTVEKLLQSIVEITEWLATEGRDFTYQSNQISLNLWLGEK